MLIAPAVRADFLAKLPGRGADAVFIDCEDAVPPGAKAEARSLAAEAAPMLRAAGCTVLVRVNAVPTEWFAADVAALSPEIHAVVVPKIETVAGIDQVAAALDAAGLTGVGVMAGIETALGVADARLLLAHRRVVAAYFGAEDFIADMGGARTEGNAEAAMARSTVALAGRLAGVAVIDQVVTDFRNDERYAVEAAEARNLGYAGKLCIHPSQVTLANDAFTPSAVEIDRARRLLDAYETASADGISAIDFEGQMVDEPLATQARNLLARVADDEETAAEEEQA